MANDIRAKFQAMFEQMRADKALARAPAALGLRHPPAPAPAPVQTPPPVAAASPAIAGAPIPTPPVQFTPQQRLDDVNSQLGVVEAEGRLLTKAGGVGTGEYNTLIKRHRDLYGQRRFLNRAYFQPTAPSINEHPVEALDRLRAEGQGQ